MVTIDVAARVWMVLPGRKAHIFRCNLADIFIRVLGGDPRLAEQIKEIGEFQDQLPANHPLRAFRDAVKPAEHQVAVNSTPDMQAVMASVKEHIQKQLDTQKQELMTMFEAKDKETQQLIAQEREARARLEAEHRALLEAQQQHAAGMIAIDTNATGSRATVTSLSTFCHELRGGFVPIPSFCGGGGPDDFYKPGKSYTVSMSILYNLYGSSIREPVGFGTFKRHIRSYLTLIYQSAYRNDSTEIEMRL